ncbi:hypothetical protein FLAVO9R_50056 [Flavobacterium sp. 9R]|uniref:hypothetical protein n=1 Tax=Flavobacterium sp. 9R TaxID=2653143 RepID=UPI0012F23553|nr:hypothetical protein [Flavobacterium sp. 9R]VXC00963.1 hypothetical protein FLAVO9R_50056 [Flavobacterium sp. 9R]
MNKLLKKITAYSLIIIVGFAAVTTLLDCFNLKKEDGFWIYFGSGNASASNTPIFFGLILIGACYLLVNSDKE